MKLARIFAVAIMVFICAAPAALAGIVEAGDWIQLISYNSFDNGGIMTYNVSHDPTTHSNPFTLSTFCIQDNTYITPFVWYEIKTITDKVGPFIPGHAGEGELNGAVDYLFYRYSIGAYDAAFSLNLPNNQGALNQADFQRLLWSLQKSGPDYTPAAGTLWALDLSTYQTNSALQQKLWGTKILNIVDSNGNDVQNQLYHVPEPSFTLLLGLGLGVVTLVAYRFKA